MCVCVCASVGAGMCVCGVVCEWCERGECVGPKTTLLRTAKRGSLSVNFFHFVSFLGGGGCACALCVCVRPVAYVCCACACCDR